MRSVSAASLRSSSPAAPVYPDISAKHHLHNTKIAIDFSPLPVASVGSAASTLPVGLSPQGILLFSRGNRIHYKNISTNEDIGQLCKLQESRGDLTIIECGGVNQPAIAALGTNKGIVQIWDITSKKPTTSWSTKGIASMRFNGPVLTIGGLKGTIRQYDTRIKEASKMKEQVRKVTRHQGRISSLSWNVDGRFLASGDENGTVYCWDSRQAVPLDVGEFVQRRKKMQHSGAITVCWEVTISPNDSLLSLSSQALAWSPWQPKLLASGDSSARGTGTIQLWDISNSSYSGSTAPGKLELSAQVTSLHFSPHCKELLSTHGPGPTRDDGDLQSWPRAINMANSVTVHSYPSLRHVVTLPVTSTGGVGGSVLTANGMKVVLAVPGENKLKLWDVWGKKKEVRRQPSFLDRSSIR